MKREFPEPEPLRHEALHRLRAEWERFVHLREPGAECGLNAGTASRAPGEESALGRRLAAQLVETLGRGTRFSVTHSHGQVLVAGFCRSGAHGESGVRFGLDLEPAARPVAEAAVRRFVRPEEAGFPLAPIELWTVKEACYKAFSGAAGTVVPDYVVVSFDPVTCLGEARYRHSARFQFKIPRIGDLAAGWTLAYATSIE